MATSPPYHLILDWDGTITYKDSLHLLPEAACAAKKLDYSKVWPPLVDAYLSDYTEHKKNYQPPANERRTLAEEFSWLRSLQAIEGRSAARVEGSGIFDGVTRAQLSQQASAAVDSGTLALRRGFFPVALPHAIEAGARVSIVSVHWSRHLIRAALQRHGELQCREEDEAGEAGTHSAASLVVVKAVGQHGQHGQQEEEHGLEPGQHHQRQPLRLDSWPGSVAGGPESRALMQQALQWIGRVKIEANELPSVELEGVPTRGVGVGLGKDRGKGIRTSTDKLAAMNALLADDGADTDTVVVYVGDSPTDLECLIAANIGICVRDEPLTSAQHDLAEALRRLGVQTHHVSELRERPWAARPPEKAAQLLQGHDRQVSRMTEPRYEYDRGLWWARDFVEITQALKSITFVQ